MQEKPKLLIVDDLEDQRILLSFILEDNYDVQEVNNGSQCLSSIKKYLPDLVLLDVMMPDLDGDEVCYNLKRDANTKHIPVVFVSSMTQQEYEEMYGDMLADAFLTKPVEAEVVLKTIRSLLAKR
jgi:CheY-like chemotaxis protein